jgi:lipoprotein-anchoring transpeptidase ErfK/SrfK
MLVAFGLAGVSNMKSVVLGIAAVLVVVAHTAARAEDQKSEPLPQAIAVSAEAQDGAVKPVVSEGSPALQAATALANEFAVTPLPPPITLTLDVDLRAQRVSVIEGDATKFVWPISSGMQGYATQTGTFQPQWTARMWYSRQWDMAPMPHSVFFNRGTAFHATTATGMLGRRASHGCIRLHPANAAKLYGLVNKHGLASTKVIVHNAGPKEPEVAARKKTKSSYQQASARPRGPRASYSGSVWGF